MTSIVIDDRLYSELVMVFSICSSVKCRFLEVIIVIMYKINYYLKNVSITDKKFSFLDQPIQEIFNFLFLHHMYNTFEASTFRYKYH